MKSEVSNSNQGSQVNQAEPELKTANPGPSQKNFGSNKTRVNGFLNVAPGKSKDLFHSIIIVWFWAN